MTNALPPAARGPVSAVPAVSETALSWVRPIGSASRVCWAMVVEVVVPRDRSVTGWPVTVTTSATWASDMSTSRTTFCAADSRRARVWVSKLSAA